MGLCEDIGGLLTSAGVCSTSAGSTGWLLCYREFQPAPPRPIRQVCVTPTGGFASEQRAPITRPSFQVRVMGSTAEGATLDTKVQAVIDALNFKDGSIGVSSWVYADIRMAGDRLYLGRDERQRPVYAVNFDTVRSRTS